jgi:folate-binding protein YgfZ
LETYGAVWATEDQLFVVVDRPEVLLDRVERFVILEDVRAELMPGEIMSVQGARASRILSEKFSLPSVDVIIDRETLLLRNDRTGSGGWDLLGPEETTAWLCEQLPEISEGDLKLATLEAGIPWPGLDADAKTLPPELGSAFENRTVSHKKGCYQGQEVLMRIHSRGRTTKTWVGLSLDGEVKPGDEVMAEGVLAGKICRASLSSSYGWIATAILKNDFAYPGTSVKVSEVRGQVVRLPFLRYD